MTNGKLIEVRPEHRSGRGRWWRPHGRGYTNQIAEAGVWSPTDPEITNLGSGSRSIALDAHPEYVAERERLVRELDLLDRRRYQIAAALAVIDEKIILSLESPE